LLALDLLGRHLVIAFKKRVLAREVGLDCSFFMVSGRCLLQRHLDEDLLVLAPLLVLRLDVLPISLVL
jgi:hypothetical protein